MTITFWGVRGSTPAPGAEFARYGGHTTCVSVSIDGKTLVLDAGTGIRPLGRSLLACDDEIFLVLTHLHADHLFGFPFFAPLYEPNRHVHLVTYDGPGEPWSPLQLFDGLHYPLEPSDLSCTVERVREHPLEYLRSHGLHVDRQSVNHPGGAYGYRITYQGKTFVFIPDNELYTPDRTVPREEIVAFCRGADVLCHDAQYLDEEIEGRRGWGHSSVAEATGLAIEAGVERLVLFHHDPDRTDPEIDAIQARAIERLAPHGIACTAAYQGLILQSGDDAPLPPPPVDIPTRAEGA